MLVELKNYTTLFVNIQPKHAGHAIISPHISLTYSYAIE